MDEEEVKRALTRRRLLKQLGIGAVWSTPIIANLRTPAYAQTSLPPDDGKEDKCGGTADAVLPTQLSPRFEETCPPDDGMEDKCGGTADAVLPAQLSPRFDGQC